MGAARAGSCYHRRMRALYTAVLYLLTPLVFLRLAWRGRRARAYWRRWPERLGMVAAVAGERPIWLHAVSVGEVLAALPLIEALLARYPSLPLLVTTTTPTGSERVREALGARVLHVYAPYDLSGAVRRFLERTRPRLALVMETELWPNLYAGLRRRRIPLLLLNARLSARSARGYRRLGSLVRGTLACVDFIAAQGRDDAERLLALGAPTERVAVLGNIKFDLAPLPELDAAASELRARWPGRPVLIAASTHEGEDEQVLDAYAQLKTRFPQLVLFLVPRHPERFERVAALVTGRGYALSRRSRSEAGAEVYLGDTMGELMTLYAAADVAFVGGSLVPTGGHNPIEPAALGLPVLCGPHVFNFAEITGLLCAAGGAQRVADAGELAREVALLLEDPARARAMGTAARSEVQRHRGALERMLERITPHLP